MTQNPHMKKNIDLREHEMLMNITSKRLCLKITNTTENGNCGSPSPPLQEFLTSPYNLRTPCTRIARAPLELDELQSGHVRISQSNGAIRSLNASIFTMGPNPG